MYMSEHVLHNAPSLMTFHTVFEAHRFLNTFCTFILVPCFSIEYLFQLELRSEEISMMSCSMCHESPEPFAADKELLLTHDCGESCDSSNLPKQYETLKKPFYNRLRPWILLHAALVTVYTVLFLFLILPQQNRTSGKIYCTIPFSIIFTDNSSLAVLLLTIVVSKHQLDMSFLIPRRQLLFYIMTLRTLSFKRQVKNLTMHGILFCKVSATKGI